jgi:hypothetical protein
LWSIFSFSHHLCAFLSRRQLWLNLLHALRYLQAHTTVPGGCLAHCMRYNTQALEHIESMLDKVAHMTFDTYRECSPQFQFCAILHLLLLLRSSIIALRVIHVLLVSINRYGFLTLLASNKRGRQPAQLSLRLFWKHLTKDSV